jgi:hypothetical protein
MLYIRLIACILLLGSCSIFNVLPSKKIRKLEFLNESKNQVYPVIYQTKGNTPDLVTIKSQYHLDSIVDLGESEFDKILYLLNWTNSRWSHNGGNKPSEGNAFTILKEASEGNKFRCVEYGVVLTSVLACFDFKSRTLGLKTRDVETTKYGAGHVVTEVWSNQFNKWFMLDAQFNLVPVLDNVPLNAVEFQDAIIQRKELKLVDLYGEVEKNRKKMYMSFIPHYLYYFDYTFDQRVIEYKKLVRIEDKVNLMLVPLGAKEPKVFQKKWPLTDYEYTSSITDFYSKPNE